MRSPVCDGRRVGGLATLAPIQLESPFTTLVMAPPLQIDLDFIRLMGSRGMKHHVECTGFEEFTPHRPRVSTRAKQEN